MGEEGGFFNMIKDLTGMNSSDEVAEKPPENGTKKKLPPKKTDLEQPQESQRRSSQNLSKDPVDATALQDETEMEFHMKQNRSTSLYGGAKAIIDTKKFQAITKLQKKRP